MSNATHPTALAAAIAAAGKPSCDRLVSIATPASVLPLTLESLSIGESETVVAYRVGTGRRIVVAKPVDDSCDAWTAIRAYDVDRDYGRDYVA